MINYGEGFDELMIEGLKREIICINGLSSTIARAKIATVEDVQDMIHMQQAAMKAEITRLGGSYE